MVLPVIAGIAASLLPSVVSALFGSKNEKQAREAVAPQYDAMVARMVGSGTPRAIAEEQADEAIKGAVQEKMGEGAIPPWLEMALSVPAYFAGAGLAKAGLKAAGKGVAKMAGGEAAAVEAKAAKGAIPEGPKTKTGPSKATAAPAGDPTKFEAGSAGLSKGELPAVADPPQGLVTPFGPKPAPKPRGTPIGEDIEPQALPGKTGLAEIDEMADEAGALTRHTGGTMPMGREQIALREATAASRANPSAPPSIQRPFRETPRLGYEEPTERGFQTQVGMTGGVAPMGADEIALREAIQASRRSPSAPPGMRRPFQPRLGYEEPAYQPPTRPRNSLTGVPSEPIGFDPLTGAPIY